MATAVARQQLENELNDGFKRLWAGNVRECINPGCEIPTRSESGQCAVCTVLQRAEERVARGEVHSEVLTTACCNCKEPFYRLGKEHTCPSCRVAALKRSDYSPARVELEKEKILRRAHAVN
jgi:hypothetical protein